MIIVDATNRRQYRDLLRQHHEQRHAAFVEDQQWDGVFSIEGREYDRYDDPARAVYLMSTDESGTQLYGSCRILSCLGGRYMLREVFPFLSDDPMPEHDRAIEMTRFVVDRNIPRACQRKAFAEIVFGVPEYANLIGAPEILILGTTDHLRVDPNNPWGFELLGPPVVMAGKTTVAIRKWADEELLAKERPNWGLEGPVITAADLPAREAA